MSKFEILIYIYYDSSPQTKKKWINILHFRRICLKENLWTILKSIFIIIHNILFKKKKKKFSRFYVKRSPVTVSMKKAEKEMSVLIYRIFFYSQATSLLITFKYYVCRIGRLLKMNMPSDFSVVDPTVSLFVW